jgi:carbamoyltransferase
MGYILGLGGPYYHDASACLVGPDGAIVAFVEEERLTRRKHSKDYRSCAQSAAWCLAKAGITLREVDEIAVGWHPRWPALAEYVTDSELIKELLNPDYFGGYTPARLTIVEHHLAHAASAFYPSGFSDAAVMIVDGAGDGAATSLYKGGPGGLKLIRQYPYTQSLGWFYETVAEHIGLGDWTSSGKLMGLAGYGKPVYDLDFLRADGDGYLLDLAPYGLVDAPAWSAESDHMPYYRLLKQAYGKAFTELGVPRHRIARRYDPGSGHMTTVTEFTPDHANFAASAQSTLDQRLLELAKAAMKEAGSARLCIAGGVGLNCSSNGVLFRDGGAQELFVQPVAGDAGVAIGAALECARRAGRLSLPGRRIDSTAWGPAFTDADIAATLKALHIPHTHHGDAIADHAARALAGGRIVGWFQGPAEGGPRALGRRSILADPRDVASRDRINRDIKRREMWRPLAPSILDESAPRFMGHSGPADFMIVAHRATEEAAAAIPATVHVDGTLRPQTVHESVDPRYADLIGKFGEATGVAALLNTSFNHEAEPIVCTPIDALRTFFSTPLDALALGGFLIEKDGKDSAAARG